MFFIMELVIDWLFIIDFSLLLRFAMLSKISKRNISLSMSSNCALAFRAARSSMSLNTLVSLPAHLILFFFIRLIR